MLNSEAAKVVGRLGHALRAAAQMGAAEPDNPAAQNAVGAVYRRSGAHDLALRHFQRAAELSPNSADYIYNVGLVQQALGDIDAAAEAFRRAIALAPDMVQAYYELVQLRRQTAAANHIAELERIFAAPDPDGLRTLHAGHALAKTYEDMGDVAKAFEWLIKAKAIRGRARPYALQDERALADAAIALARSRDAGEGFDTEEPIFVVGLPRTGTTLVDRILSSHAAIVSVGELSNFAQLMKAMAATPSKLAFDVPTLTEAGRLDMQSLGRAYVESTRPTTEAAPRFVDKAPINYLVAGLIHRALPNARIVSLVRDPLDTCLSLFRQMFATEHPYYDYVYDLRATAHAYVNFRHVASHLRAALPPDRYMEVRYEDLVSDLEQQARRMIGFCGLEWDARCLSFHENPSAVATPSAAQVRQPLYRTSIGRWRSYGALLDPAREVLEREGLLAESGR